MEESKTVLDIVKNVGSGYLSDNMFERAIQLEEWKKNLEEASAIVNAMIEDIYKYIEGTNVEDENYKLVPVFNSKKTSTLDVDSFEKELPEEYDRSLTIKASEAEKVLGKDVLREMVIEKIGWDNFVEIADITLTEARKNIPKSLQPKYIKEEYKQIGYTVEHK